MALDIERLEILRNVHLRGSMKAAGEALFMTASAVSQNIKALEGQAGTHLVETVGGKAHLTEAGRILVNHTDNIIAARDAAEVALAELMNTPAGAVRVGAFPTGASTFLTDALADLAHCHPQVRTIMIEGNPEQSLLALHLNQLDVVVAYEYPYVPVRPDPLIEKRELFEDPLVLLIPAGWFPVGHEVSLAELSGRPWAMAPHGVAYGQGVRRACQRAGFEADVRVQTYDISVMEAQVKAGLAAAIVPRLGVVAHPLPAEVEEHAIAGQPLARRVFVAFRAGGRTPAVKVTIEALVEAAAKVVPKSAS